MRNKLYFSTTVLVSVVIFWGGMSYGTVPAAPVASFADGNAPTVKRWEHCTLALTNGFVKNGPKVTGSATINYVQDAGLWMEKIEATVDESISKSENVEDTVLAKAIGKLGGDGWELVGEGTLLRTRPDEQKVLYFKRPRR